ncbi:hypothetical protein Dimus_038780 [Dionaea muscipula]
MSRTRFFIDAMASKNSDNWKIAMNEEIDSLKKNNTWTLVPKPEKCRIIECKWIYKVKEGITKADPVRYKARLVAKGFTQKEGIDYTEIFSPVVKFKTIRIMLAVTAFYDLELEQMDVKTAFLNGDLDETIFMSQPEGYTDSVHKNFVCKLNKSLYGLKQAPRQWYKRFDTFVTKIGFHRSKYDVCLYYAFLDDFPLYLLLYVDDMLLISKSISLIEKFKHKLNSEFDMKDLGHAKKILGMEIERDRKLGELKLHQTSYIKRVCSKFKIDNSKPVSLPLAGHFILSKLQSPKTDSEKLKMESVPYLNAIGSVMYSMVSTRPDLSFSISLLSRYMSNPGPEHWNALKWLLRYLNCTASIGLLFKKWTDKLDLAGFVDADFAVIETIENLLPLSILLLEEIVLVGKHNCSHLLHYQQPKRNMSPLSMCSKKAFGFKDCSKKLICWIHAALSLLIVKVLYIYVKTLFTMTELNI